MKQIKFYAAANTKFSDKDAQVIGETLISLKHRTPSALLDVSRPLRAKTHRYFEWKDSKAAESWRLRQAAECIRSIVIEVKPPARGAARQEIRFFLSSHQESDDSTNPKREYHPLPTILRSEVMTAEVLEAARQGLASWKMKFENYTILFKNPAFCKAMDLVQDAIETMDA